MSTYLLVINNVAQGVAFTPPAGKQLADCWPADMLPHFVDITSANPQPQAGWAWDGTTWTPPASPTATPQASYTAEQFFEMFTTAEQAAIQAACQANAQLGVGLTHGLAAGTINPADQVTQQWLAGLVTAGALTQARADYILSAAPQQTPAP